MAYTDITIQLTIGKETRELTARAADRFDHQEVITWASVTTTHGTVAHTAALLFKRNAADTYTLRDCISIEYPGKRGNGHARPSQFRHIGFLEN